MCLYTDVRIGRCIVDPRRRRAALFRGKITLSFDGSMSSLSCIARAVVATSLVVLPRLLAVVLPHAKSELTWERRAAGWLFSAAVQFFFPLLLCRAYSLSKSSTAQVPLLDVRHKNSILLRSLDCPSGLPHTLCGKAGHCGVDASDVRMHHAQLGGFHFDCMYYVRDTTACFVGFCWEGMVVLLVLCLMLGEDCRTWIGCQARRMERGSGKRRYGVVHDRHKGKAQIHQREQVRVFQSMAHCTQVRAQSVICTLACILYSRADRLG